MIKEMVQFVTDKYDRQARLYPALTAALPGSALALVLTPALSGVVGKLAGLVVASGFPIVATNMARDKGKAVEQRLYKEWGAMPTTILLRFKNATNQTQVQRWHDLLQQLVGPSPIIPAMAAERSAPRKADQIYETAVTTLREATRNKTKFELVFKELCIYGWRRNLLGLKPIGLGLALVSAIISAGVYYFFPSFVQPQALLVVVIFDLLMAIFWIAVVKDDWVKAAAFTYAKTLLAALEKT